MSPAGPDREAPLCITCGYDLTGQPIEGLCPECGDPIWRPELARLIAGGGWSRAWGAFLFGLLSLPGMLLFGIGGVVLGALAIYISSGIERDYLRGGISASARHLSGVGQVLGFFGCVFGLCVGLLWLIF
jgi:predicted RNA-binding Zn-ribbon protein involved in translation (DUF1610 family)